MKKNIAIVILAISLFPLCFISCSARRVKKEMSGSNMDSKAQAGELVFKNQCQKCHPGGESGVGPPVNNIHLPGFLIRARVRSRAFLLWMGRMPAFDKHEISEKEMDDLLQYLKYLRKGT